ncbi:hypothetical protein O9992_27875 [Vibrio lentus]|nr:hypothetical protein [Vibrio lentus]
MKSAFNHITAAGLRWKSLCHFTEVEIRAFNEDGDIDLRLTTKKTVVRSRLTTSLTVDQPVST